MAVAEEVALAMANDNQLLLVLAPVFHRRWVVRSVGHAVRLFLGELQVQFQVPLLYTVGV